MLHSINSQRVTFFYDMHYYHIAKSLNPFLFRKPKKTEKRFIFWNSIEKSFYGFLFIPIAIHS